MLARIVLIALALLIAGPAIGAPGAQIGYVDMQQVLEQSRLGMQAQERLEEKFGPRRGAFAQEELAIREMQEQFERDKPLMSQSLIDKREEEIEARIRAFQKELSAVQKQILAEQQEISERIIGPALKAVERVASKERLTAVFERQRAGLLYVDDGIDLTAAVVKQLDADTK